MKYISIMLSILLNPIVTSLYANEVINGSLQISIADSIQKILQKNIHEIILRSRKFKKYDSVQVKHLIACLLRVICDSTITDNLTVNGNQLVGHDLTINRNELVRGDLTVLGTLFTNTVPVFIDNITLIGTPQGACIIFKDAFLNEKARICSSSIPGDKGVFVSIDGGVTQNLRVNNAGGSVIAPPVSGPGLSVSGNVIAPAIISTGNATLTAPALSLINNPPASPTNFVLTIDPSGAVTQSAIPIGNGFITNECQPGPIIIGTSDLTALTLVTNCLNRLSIDPSGAVVIAMPTAGEALIVNGNIVLPEANGAETQGLLKLGGTNTASNVVIYEIGTRNLFAGNGAVNAAVTGTDNISIGTNANSTLTAANNVIAIGTSASATATDSIAVGDEANTAQQRTIVIGSRDSASTGIAPTTTALNAIAIGSARLTQSGALASGLSAIAIGQADVTGNFAGAQATGNRSIALGVNAAASANATIAIGGASGTIGGIAPVASSIVAIAIGSAQIAQRGVLSNNFCTIGIGGSDGVFPGPAPEAPRSIAIGLNANTAGSGPLNAIALGSASGVAGGVGPISSAATGIAIGSAQGALAAPVASGVGGVAIGSSDGVSIGAVASGPRTVAIGTGASVAVAERILLGNAAATAVRVGIGSSAPVSKLEVVGADGTVVTIWDQVNTAIGNAPVWLNRSTSAVAGTPIHYDASNRLFGFTSSKRYKTNIRSINEQSHVIYQLNPVLYDSKKQYGYGKDIPGFIAEDVYEVAPNLVILNNKNKPENIAYNSLHAFAIKEIQKHHQQIEAHQNVLDDNAADLATLLTEVSQLQINVNNANNVGI